MSKLATHTCHLVKIRHFETGRSTPLRLESNVTRATALTVLRLSISHYRTVRLMKKLTASLIGLACLTACSPPGTTVSTSDLQPTVEEVIKPTGDSTGEAIAAPTTEQSEPILSNKSRTATSAATSSTPQEEPASKAEDLSPGTFTIAFAGDMHFERRAKALTKDPTPLVKSLADTIGKADFAVGNLETAITERGTPIPGKKYTFRAPASSVKSLAEAGFDVVSLANNHGADYGAQGLADTLKAKESAPIPVIGVGKNAEEAYAATSATIDGVKTAILGASLLSDHTTRLYTATDSKPGIAYAAKTKAFMAAVKNARESHDVVIAFLHWGREGMTCPQARQVNMVKQLQEAGVDIMVGAHAHRVQGHGWHKDAYVGYGLGNFIWYHNRQPSSHTGVLTLTLDKERIAANREASAAERVSVVVKDEWTPMLIHSSGVPKAVTGARKAQFLKAVSAANKCSKLARSAT